LFTSMGAGSVAGAVFTPQFHKKTVRDGGKSLGWLPDRIESG
jgi:hypothetical protein